jgi:hypothetical protein
MKMQNEEAQKRFVVYPGKERFPLNAETEAIGLTELARALQGATGEV